MRTVSVPRELPIDLWTLSTANKRSISASLVREGSIVTLAWFVDGGVEGVEDFDSWDDALEHADAVRRMFLRWGPDEQGLAAARP